MARIEYLRHKKVNAAVDDGVSEVQPKDWNDDAHDQVGIHGYDDAIKTLVAGAFTFADTLQVIAAETGVTDDLDTLTTTDALVNDLAIIKADTGDTITVKSGTGNILLPGGIDIIIDATIKQHLILIYDGTNWKLPKVIGNAIVDDNDNEVIIFGKTASAVNEITIKNAATGTDAELQATGGDTDIGIKLVPKGTGKIYGNRESWGFPLTDEDTAPTTGVKYTTEPAPYDMTIDDIIAGLKTAGTGAALFTFDILKEDSVNADTFTTIFSTKPTIDASEFTSTTAAAAMVLSVTTWEKGRRMQLKIDTLDTDALARGAKIVIIAHSTAR